MLYLLRAYLNTCTKFADDNYSFNSAKVNIIRTINKKYIYEIFSDFRSFCVKRYYKKWLI